MRTIIDLPDPHLDALDAVCRREKISRAEAVRRAVDLYVKSDRAGDSAAAFGLWRGRAVDGVEYERRLRREWNDRSRGR